MSMFGPKMGSWEVHSDIDPRWNKSGRAIGYAMGGGPIEMQEWIKQCTENYGLPPDDATEEFWKD